MKIILALITRKGFCRLLGICCLIFVFTENYFSLVIVFTTPSKAFVPILSCAVYYLLIILDQTETIALPDDKKTKNFMRFYKAGLIAMLLIPIFVDDHFHFVDFSHMSLRWYIQSIFSLFGLIGMEAIISITFTMGKK